MPGADRLPAGLDADAHLLAAAAREAAGIALGFFGRSPQVFTKGDHSPVTEADLAVDARLAVVLREARPDYGWLSEESKASDPGTPAPATFVVDPIDGTRAFIAGRDDWTISLAVVTDGRPTAAAVYCPIRDEMFLASAGAGAYLGGGRLSTSSAASLAGSRVAGPGRLFEHDAAHGAGIVKADKVHSLAYRLALVAAARIDAAAASARACHWDLAASDLLVHEAGGRLTDLAGRTVRYDGPEVRHPPLVAAGPRLLGAFAAFVATIVEAPERHGRPPGPAVAARS